MTYCFEVADDGSVTRQVELQGPERGPRSAASLVEVSAAQAGGTVGPYLARYGDVSEGPVSDRDDDFPGESITADEFDAVWVAARQAL